MAEVLESGGIAGSQKIPTVKLSRLKGIGVSAKCLILLMTTAYGKQN
jgi:hypothetical protein